MKQGLRRAGQHVLGNAGRWFAMAMVGIGLALPAPAATHLTSTNIALIPNTTGGGYGGGGAGTINPAWFPQFSFTQIVPTAVNETNLNAFDTVILYQFCNVGSYPTFTSNLVAWLQNTGGKLVIWDADSCPSSTSYAWLAPLGATFDRTSPNGIGGSGGSLAILDDSRLGSSDPSSPYYINGAAIAAGTDALNDLTTVNENTASSVWCANMRGTNGLNRSGFAHMYAKPGGLVGAPDAFIIYSGLDTDSISAPGTSGGGQIAKLFGLDLAHGWGPPGSAEIDDLSCQVPVGNLVLTPVNATNQVGQIHTVIATVTTQNPIAGSTPVVGNTVNFAIISGPNAGTTGTAVTDTNGQCSFSWVSASAGVDTVMASTTVNGILKTYNATKVWIASEAPNLIKYNFDTNAIIGQILTYALTFDTFSNTVPALGLVMIDYLPLEVDLVSFTTNGAVSTFFDSGSHAILWDFGTFPPLTQGPTNYVTVQVNTNAFSVTNILNHAQLLSSNLPPTVAVDHNPNCLTCYPGVPVTPNRPPVAVCTNVTVAAVTNCSAFASIDGGSYDPDNDPITIVQIPPGPYPLGTNNVCLIVSDGHTTNGCCAVVTVVDRTPPTIHCPTNIVVNNSTGLCSAVVNYTVTASDDCSGPPVHVAIYQQHSQAGGGAPYSGFIGEFDTSSISFATDTGYSWHPFGATDFGADITGCMDVAADGNYTFSLNSDDGSQLYIDGNLVVDNSGVHSPQTSSGSATLTGGKHTFEVQFFECCNDPSGVDVGLPAGVTFGSCGLSVTTTPPSGSVFPAGTTTVTSTATDAAGNTNSCSFTVTVLDKEPPVAACRAAVNPGDKKIPVAGKDPKSGQNPDGYYQLLGKDNCDSATNLVLYIHDTASGFIAGPFHSGDIIKLRQSPGGTPSSTPDSPPITAQVRLKGDAALYAVDSSGNVSQPAYCFVPPPPK